MKIRFSILVPLAFLLVFCNPLWQSQGVNPEIPPTWEYRVTVTAPTSQSPRAFGANFINPSVSGGCPWSVIWALPPSEAALPGVNHVYVHKGTPENDLGFLTSYDEDCVGTINYDTDPRGISLNIKVPAEKKPADSIRPWLSYTHHYGRYQPAKPITKPVPGFIALWDYKTGACTNAPSGGGSRLPPGTYIGGGSNNSDPGNNIEDPLPIGEPDCEDPARPDQGEVTVDGETVVSHAWVEGRGEIAVSAVKTIYTPLQPPGANQVQVRFRPSIVTVNTPTPRDLKGLLSITTIGGSASAHSWEVLGKLPTQILGGGPAGYRLLEPGHAGCGVHDWHGERLTLIFTRLQPGSQVIELLVDPDDGEPVKIVQLTLEDAPPEEPESDSASFTYTESGGNRFRKIALDGKPMPDGKPQAEDEKDVEEENAYVDALTMNLAYDTTDVYVPLLGDSLALAVRRQSTQEIWNNQPGPSPNALSFFNNYERPFGAGWRTGLAANIRIDVPQEGGSNAGPTIISVTDEQGATHRFAQIWNPANTTAPIGFVPLPSQATDQDTFLMSLEILEGPGTSNWQLGPAGWRLTFKRKFGTTLRFEPLAFPAAPAFNYPFTNIIDSTVAGSNLVTTKQGATIQRVQYFYRLLNSSVQGADCAVSDSNGNRLYYTFGSEGDFVPSIISPEPGNAPVRRLQITRASNDNGLVGLPYNNRLIGSVKLFGAEAGTSPEWKYLYSVHSEYLPGTPSPGQQKLAQLIAVVGPDLKIQRGYNYKLEKELDSFDEPLKIKYIYHWMMTGIIDGGGFHRNLTYIPDKSREIGRIQINPPSADWYVVQDSPYRVSSVSLKAPNNPLMPFNTAGAFLGSSIAAWWTSSFMSDSTGQSKPYRIQRSVAGILSIKDAATRVTTVRDANNYERVWTFSAPKVLSSERFKNLFFPSGNAFKNPVAQVCWTEMSISQQGLQENYWFKPELGMALVKSRDLSRVITEWEYKDPFRASWFVTQLAGVNEIENGILKPVEEHSFFPQFYSDPTKQTRINPAGLPHLVKEFYYWSTPVGERGNVITNPLIIAKHKKSWSRALNKSLDENGVITDYLLDDAGNTATGWVLTETVRKNAAAPSPIRTTDFWYGSDTGNPAGRVQVGAPAFIWKTSITDGIRPGLDLVTIKQPDLFWHVKQSIVGNPVGSSNEKQVQFFEYDSLGRMTASADGRGAATNLSVNPFATTFHYDTTGRLKQTKYPKTIGSTYPEDAESRAITDVEYDLRGLPKWRTDQSGLKSHYTYDAAGRMTRRWIDINGNNSFDAAIDSNETSTYDRGGQILNSTNAAGLLTMYGYDSRGFLIWVETEDMKTPAVANSDAILSNIAYEYDFGNNYPGGSLFASSTIRPTRITGPFRFSFDPNSRVLTKIQYNFAGRKISESTQIVEDGPYLTTTFEYDGVGNLTKKWDAAAPPKLTQTSYDALSRAETVTQPDGSSINNLWSAAGLARKITLNVIAPGNNHVRESAVLYDAAGRKQLESLPDPASGTVDESGLNWNVRYTYGPSGQADKIERKRNAAEIDFSEYFYDERGRLIKEKQPAIVDADAAPPVPPAQAVKVQPVVQTWYDLASRITKSLGPRGEDSYIFYDAAGRPTRKVSARLLIYGQTGDKRLVSTTNYDPAGHPLKVTSGLTIPAADEKSVIYDSAGSSAVENIHSARGFLMETRAHPLDQPGGANATATRLVTKFEYDALGNKLKVTDAEGNATAFKYDPLGRVLETWFHAGTAFQEVTRNYYDHAVLTSSEEKMRDGTSSRIKNFQYNELYQLKKTIYSATGAVMASTDYTEDRVANSVGELLSVTVSPTATAHGSRNVIYQYDRRGRLFSETSLGRGHYYTHDQAGNRLTASYILNGAIPSTPNASPLPSARSTVVSVYDAQNRLDTMTENARATSYVYDRSGNLRRKILPNGITEETSFDAAGRTTELKRTRVGLAAALDLTAYAYNAMGSTASVAETYPAAAVDSGNTAVPRTIVNTYDRIQRLASEAITAGGTLTTTGYSYDKAGNRTSRTVALNGNAATVMDISTHGVGLEDFDNNGTSEAGYGANQLRKMTRVDGSKVLYLYDDFGNRSAKREYGPPGSTTGTETKYVWDQNNMLIQVTRHGLTPAEGGWTSGAVLSTWEYSYDHRGRRVIRNGEAADDAEVFIYAGGNSVQQVKVVETTLSAWRTSPAGQSLSVFGLTYVRGSDFGGGVGGILYSLSFGQPTYQQHNSRGDVTAYTNGVGAYLMQMAYDAYGKHVDTGTTFPAGRTQRASSKEEEPLLNLLNEGFRYRDTESGAFMSRDPAGFVDGPNLYAYVMQNPWSAFDPHGLATVLGSNFEMPPTTSLPNEQQETTSSQTDLPIGPNDFSFDVHEDYGPTERESAKQIVESNLHAMANPGQRALDTRDPNVIYKEEVDTCQTKANLDIFIPLIAGALDFAVTEAATAGFGGWLSLGKTGASTLRAAKTTGPSTTRLFRAVEGDELADVMKYGDYNIHHNSTFKRFAFDEGSLDDFIKANPTRSYTKTFIDVPTKNLGQMYRHADPGGVGKSIGIDVYETPTFYNWFDKVNILGK